MLTIGNKIRNLRKSNSHSQEDLSELLQVTRQAISKWKNDASLPDIHTLTNLCDIYNVTLDFFKEAGAGETGKEVIIKQINQSKDLYSILIPYGSTILTIGNVLAGIFFGPLSLIVSIPSLMYSFKKQILEIILCMAIVLLGSNQLFTIVFGRESVPHRIQITTTEKLE